jgi:hypothetical protein
MKFTKKEKEESNHQDFILSQKSHESWPWIALTYKKNKFTRESNTQKVDKEKIH